MEQVARLANVSVTTVSRVLNNPLTVSKDTRDRVLSVIKSLNYEPNFLGRSLRKTQTNVVLVLVHDVDNPFFSDIIKGVENVANVYDYSVIMANNHGSKEIGNRYFNMLRNHLIDGIILLSSELEAAELDKLADEYPLVQLVEFIEDSKACAIYIDYGQATRELMEVFIADGRKKIAFINTNICPIISTKIKHQAYLACLQKHGLEVLTPEPHPLIEFGYESSYQITQDILKSHPDVDAIFCCSDLIAAGAIAACQQAGRIVPTDVAISGFDNLYYSEINNPTITTVSHDTVNLGLVAMEFIIKMINHQEIETNRHILPHEIIYRQSMLPTTDK